MDHHARTEHAIDPTTMSHRDDQPLLPDTERRRFIRLAGGLLLITATTVVLVGPLRAEVMVPKDNARGKPFAGRARRRDRKARGLDRQDWNDMSFIEQVELHPRKGGRRLRYPKPVASSRGMGTQPPDLRRRLEGSR